MRAAAAAALIDVLSFNRRCPIPGLADREPEEILSDAVQLVVTNADADDIPDFEVSVRRPATTP
jgi:hypothetical protein